MRLSTGIPGLDDILHGGLAKGFLYLIEGNPGAGKTTLALQFLLEGARQGESGLYISLAESEGELRHVAEPHGFVLDHVTIAKISPPELSTAAGQYTVFQPAEVELADVLETILARVREVNPSRVVIDSMSELRMLARDSLRYRRQILSLKQFFEGRDCTTLLLDERFRENPESQVQTIAHGAISLVVLARDYGITRRRVEVLKIRASSFREGYHDFVIVRGGLRVFPRLISGEHRNVRVGQLAATMAHEVNNPLEALTNLLFLVEMSNNVEEARSFGHLAAQELGRISEIVNQTLRFHRAPAKPAFTDVGELATSALALFHGKMRKKRITEDLQVQKTYAFCSAGEIRQALVNLIGNALDAMAEGGRLSLRVSAATRSDFHYARLTVGDTGTGIGAEIRPNLFTQFFTTKGSGGTGLGLWLTRDIVLRNGGRLRFRSRTAPPSGTVFCMYLPSLPPLEAARPNGSQRASDPSAVQVA